MPGHIPLPLLRAEALGGTPRAKEAGTVVSPGRKCQSTNLGGCVAQFNPMLLLSKGPKENGGGGWGGKHSIVKAGELGMWEVRVDTSFPEKHPM